MLFFRKARHRLLGNIRIGKPDVAPDLPSHVPGVRGGNNPRGVLEREPGFRKADPGMLHGTARRSTGIGAKHRNPIDPLSMPNLSPA